LQVRVSASGASQTRSLINLSSFALRASEDTILRWRELARLVDQNSASWNPVMSWLRLVERLRHAA
jgi:hypothetical protein